MKKAAYPIIYSIWYAISLLPLWVLYRISDLLFLLVYYVIRYRRKIVRANMVSSFPEKQMRDIVSIEKKYYKWFCDYVVETIKMLTMSRREMKKRMRFENLDLMNNPLSEGRNVSIFLGHYCNWEWIASLGMHFVSNVYPCQLYHPLENQVFDKLFLYMRGRFGSHSLPMDSAFNILLEKKRECVPTVTGYISDQVPGFSSMHYWPNFLNHKTPTFTGAERISRILDTTVVYMDVVRVRRGYYVGKVVKICDKPSEMPKFSITEKYYQLLETTINRNPEYWLWSHNRWKRTWEDFCKVYPSETERDRILSKL